MELATATTTTTSDFHVALEGMRAHHLSRKGGDFFAAQPQFRTLLANDEQPGTDSLLANDNANDNQAVAEALKPVTSLLASQQQTVASDTTTGANNAVNDLKTSKNQDDFKAKLNAQRQKALDDSDANINAAFDKAGQLGEAHPEAQSGILAGMNVVQNIITNFTGLISDMVSKVVSLVTDILNGIMNAVSGVIEGFAGEAGAVLGGLL
jgi:hypothetical protein